ncbi:MAG: hypothetical protein VX130_01530 [Verrucomicrobiota bacterium]|nr:hypothetical protein [Verrucomicrobiota bacterium]
MLTLRDTLLRLLGGMLVLLLASCGGGSASTLPEAPPPYPGFPVPPSPSNQAEPPSPYRQNNDSGYYAFGSPNRPAYRPSEPSFQSTPQPAPQNHRYLVNAKGNLWVLVQDQFGNEVDWQKLNAGENFPITQPGALTVTLSSSDKAEIYDSDNKKIEVNSTGSGISIVRLP